LGTICLQVFFMVVYLDCLLLKVPVAEVDAKNIKINKKSLDKPQNENNSYYIHTRIDTFI
jgi:hypothetical protein